MDLDSHYRNRKVLITGGLGFLGSNLAIDLAAKGAEITILDSLHHWYGGNHFNIEPISDRVRLIPGDLRDVELVREAVEGQELVFHIAAQTSHVDSMTSPLFDVDVNCRGTILLLEAMKELAPGARLVYAGTRAQFGKLDYTPVDEKHGAFPVDIYGVNKHAGELYAFVYMNAHGIPATSLRINNSYGPRHQMKHGKYGILNWFVRLAMDGDTIRIFGEGSQLRDYNHVDDVTRAFLAAGASDAAPGQVYNLGCGDPISFRDMVKAIIETTGSGRYEHVPWPKEREDIEVGDYVADFSKATRELDWKPLVPFQQGLEETVAFYREHQTHYWLK